MPHNTGARVVIGNKKPYEVAWWQPYRQLQEEGIREEDSRIRGPALTTFPHTTGWKIDAEGIVLDELTIKKITYHFTQRIFRPPVDRHFLIRTSRHCHMCTLAALLAGCACSGDGSACWAAECKLDRLEFQRP